MEKELVLSRFLQKARDLPRKMTTLLFLVTVMVWPQTPLAATNEAIDPGGGSVTLLPSGSLTVNSVQLALINRARDLAGAVLPNGSNVAAGQQIYFVLYVENTTTIEAINVQIEDSLNEAQFAYVPGSVETTIVATGSSDAAIWAGTWSPLTDSLGGPDDMASFVATDANGNLNRFTAGMAAGQANQQMNVPGGMIRAFRFKAIVK